MMLKTDNRVFDEDSLFDNFVLNYIVGTHGLKNWRVLRHVRSELTSYQEEVDVVVYGWQRRNVFRVACIELKESDFDTLLIQAINRTFYCHYSYAVIKTIIFTPKTPKYLKNAIDLGVGIIQYIPNYRDEENNRIPWIHVLRHARLQRNDNHDEMRERFAASLKGILDNYLRGD